jgi:hypothetical protein
MRIPSSLVWTLFQRAPEGRKPRGSQGYAIGSAKSQPGRTLDAVGTSRFPACFLLGGSRVQIWRLSDTYRGSRTPKSRAIAGSAVKEVPRKSDRQSYCEACKAGQAGQPMRAMMSGIFVVSLEHPTDPSQLDTGWLLFLCRRIRSVQDERTSAACQLWCLPMRQP